MWFGKARFGKANLGNTRFGKPGFKNQVWKSLVAMADGQYPPNKWGYQGFNCKWRPSGSGTTHATRREQRRQKQWEWLQQHEPDTEDTLQKQLTALEKAAEKAQQRLKEMQEKKGKQTRKRRRNIATPTIPQVLQKRLPKRARAKQGQWQHLWKRKGPGLCQ